MPVFYSCGHKEQREIKNDWNRSYFFTGLHFYQPVQSYSKYECKEKMKASEKSRLTELVDPRKWDATGFVLHQRHADNWKFHYYQANNNLKITFHLRELGIFRNELRNDTKTVKFYDFWRVSANARTNEKKIVLRSLFVLLCRQDATARKITKKIIDFSFWFAFSFFVTIHP